MSTMYKTVESLCKQNGTTVSALAQEIGLSKSTMSELKAGRSQSLSAKSMDKIAKHFNVSMDFLNGSEQKEKPTENGGRDVLDEVDVAFYGEYRELNTDEKEVVRDMIRVMRERRAKKQGK